MCENSFHCEGNSVGSRDCWALQHVCIRHGVVKDGSVVVLRASLLRLWEWSVKGFVVKAVLFHIFMLIKHTCFKDLNFNKMFCWSTKQIHKRTISVPLGAFWLTALKLSLLFCSIYVSDGSMESLVIVPRLKNCKSFLCVPCAGKLGREMGTGEWIATAFPLLSSTWIFSFLGEELPTSCCWKILNLLISKW